jgi:SulP family sulfate permease
MFNKCIHQITFCTGARRFRAIIPGFVTDRTEAGPDTALLLYNLRTFLCPQFLTPPLPATCVPSCSPSLLTREVLAGVLTALALIPEVISFSVIAGVDPQVSLIASVCSVAMSPRRTPGDGHRRRGIGGAGHWPDGASARRGLHSAAVILAGMIQILFGLCGMARLMRFIPRR